MKGTLPPMPWIVLGLVLMVSFGIDLANTMQGGAIDLRNRVTGVRLLAAHVDPYHYKWHEPEAAEYCDPYNNPKLPVSKTTATPALLAVHLPLAPLPYRLGQMLWLVAQWLLIVGTVWMWVRGCSTERQRWLVALFVVGFTYTASWRLHAERGQAYVLLTFLFAWWLTAVLDPKRGDGFLAGLAAGFLVALRPPFALLVPFLALHRRGQLAGSAVGLLLGLGLPMLLRADCWTEYFSAMRSHSWYYRTDFNPHYTLAYPPEIEHISTDLLAKYVPIPFADFSAHAFLKWLGFAPFPVLPLLLVIIAPFALWLWYSRAQSVASVLPGVAAWFVLVDLFLPAFRNSYNDVLILDVFALGVVTMNRIPWGAWPCLIALPAGWCVYAFTLDAVWLINLPAFLFTLGCVGFIFGAAILPVQKRVPSTRPGGAAFK